MTCIQERDGVPYFKKVSFVAHRSWVVLLNHMAAPQNVTDAQVRQVFDIFDADGSGFMEVEELGFAMQALGLGVLPKESLDALVTDTCPPGTVQIDFKEFLLMVRTKTSDRNSVEEAVRNFGLALSSSSPDGTLPPGKITVTIEDLLDVARRSGELQDGDVESEKKWRRIFTQTLKEANCGGSTAAGIPLSVWIQIMRESSSDKRHRIRDTGSYNIKTRARVAKRGPYGTRVEEGKTYFFCTCGMSKNQPFCDGSHNEFNISNGTNFEPIAFTAEETKTVWLCGCKRSNTLPFCDGTHSSLPVPTSSPTE